MAEYALDLKTPGTCVFGGVLRLETHDRYSGVFAPVTAAIRGSAGSFTLDLADLVFLDSSGIRALADLILLAHREGVHLILIVNPRVPWQEKTAASLLSLQTGLVVMVRGDACGERLPDLRVRTLGGLELAQDGRRVELRGNAHQKPLGLLTLLVALGGKDVPFERLTDVLWPEADGDLARTSLDTTLHRLRKLFARADAVELSKGRLSLNERACWVDAWAFEKLCSRLDSERTISECFPQEALAWAKEAMALYRGPFLPAERHAAAGAYREHLRVRFIRTVVRISDHWQARHEMEKSVAVLLEGLSADVLAEELHVRLMVCLQDLGRLAEALSAYERCRDSLHSGMGIEPSPTTEALYRSIREQATRRAVSSP